MAHKPMIIAEIFCGAGGLSAGFKEATAWWPDNKGEGYKIAYGVDWDIDAIAAFRAFHFPGLGKYQLEIVAPCEDIKNVTAENILAAIRPHRSVDVLIGGPSCQGVSPAGLRNPDDPRNSMLLAFIRIVKELRPKWFVMENVPGLTHENNRELLAAILEKLQAIRGYKVMGDVVLAAEYGVPQFRYRLFIIGTNTGAPIRFPKPAHTSPSLNGDEQLHLGTQSYQTLRQAILDLADVEPEIYKEDVSPIKSNQPTAAIPNHYCVGLTEINKARIAAMKPGQDWRDMPINLLPERYFVTRSSDQKGSYGRLRWDWPAYTLTNAVCNVTSGPFTHPDHNRVISVREAARLQSFSDDHIFYGSLRSQYCQVGNAVPPKLARAVGEAILYCHYQRRKAKNWGRPGRLSYEIIRDALANRLELPALTSRHVDPLFDRRKLRKGVDRRQVKENIESRKSAWNAKRRPADPYPDATRRLRRLAEQPGYCRSAKRARAIVQFLDGVDKEIIIKDANVSEASVSKWVDGYFTEGLNGWRAYHNSLEEILETNPKLAKKIKKAKERVRQTLLAPSKNGQANKQPKRLHMNSYLLKLIKRFGRKSVAELIIQVEDKLDAGIGTVYVEDLLAICDIVLDKKNLRGRLINHDNTIASPLKDSVSGSHSTKAMPMSAKNP